MTDYRLREAGEIDISDIMKIEFDAFAEGIREDKLVFLDRIGCYPEGFILLKKINPVKHSDEKRETFCSKSARRETCEFCETSGYFSSELWNKIPEDKKTFSLGHSAKNCHCPKGTVLYISSYAILSKLKGNGLGKEFFRETVKHILNENSNIKELVLLVNEDWKGAFHIYESCGFVQYDTIDRFFSVPVGDEIRVTDGYLMKCTRETFLEMSK